MTQATGSCPRCGAFKTGGQQFCGSCGLDLRVPSSFGTAPPAAGGVRTSPSRGSPLVGLIVLVVIAAGIYEVYAKPASAPISGGGGGNAVSTPFSGGGAGNAVSTPSTATEGHAVSVNGVELTMLAAQFPTALPNQNPPAGSVFAAYEFRIRNTSTNPTYVGVTNFTVAADSGQQGQVGFAVNDAWLPQLAIDQLAPGNSITGWLVFTVPHPSSYLLLTYADNPLVGAPAVQWRNSCC